MSRIWLVLLWLLVLGSIAEAQDVELTAEELRVEGLSFMCRNCAWSGDEFIEVPLKGERMLVTADKVAELMLEELLRTGYDGAHPSAPELHRFLFQKPRSDGVARLALSLLMQTGSGSQILRSNAQRYIETYYSLMMELLRKGRGNQQLWDALWQIPESVSNERRVRLRAAVAVNHPNLGLPQFVETLSVVNSGEDLKALVIFRQEVLGFRPKWARALRGLIESLDACRLLLVREESDERCRSTHFSELPDYFVRYLERVRVAILLQYFESKPVDPQKALALLAEVDYENYRTPRTHLALVQVLRDIIASNDRAARELALERYKSMLQFFAANDNEVGSKLAILHVLRARELFEQEQFEALISELKASIALYPAALNERRDLVEQLSGNAAVNESRELSAEVDALLVQTQAKPRRQSPINLLLFIGTVLVVVIIAFFVLRKDFVRHRPLDESDNQLAAEERRELRDLLRAFNLQGFASEDELAQCYHELAKRFHPDREEGSEEEFSRITERYNRARYLIRKR